MPVENKKLWASAVGTFIVGDVVTTHIGITEFGAVEAHPISAEILGIGGTAGMVAMKLGVLGGFMPQRNSRQKSTGVWYRLC